MKRNCLSLLSGALICTYACDNRTVLTGPGNSNVTVSPASATVNLSTTQQFTATVKNSTNQSVIWSVTGSGCSGADCGSINASGLYRAPDTYIAGASVTVVATSQVDPSQAGTAAVTITSLVTVSVPDQSIDIGATRRLSATVNGSTNQAVTWSISGPGCDGAGSCGFIDAATGVYTAPDEPPVPATFSAQATSVADTSKSGSGRVTITLTSNQGFVGDYAFVLSGFESSGRVIAIAGAFHTQMNPDNTGRITEGILEMDRSTSSPLLPVAISGGAYSYGADNRGRLQLDTPVGSFSFRCAMNNPSAAQAGRIILFQPDDPTHISGSGLIKKQDHSATTLTGDFAFGFWGDWTGGRGAAMGRFTLGTTISGTLDVNLSGIITLGFSVPPANVDNSGAGNSYGRRGAMLMPPQPGPLPAIMNLSFYIVSPNEAFFITRARAQDDPLLSGDAVKQSGTLSISGPLVFYSTGLLSPGTVATVARFLVSGSSFLGVLDQNSDGVITSNAPLSGQILGPDSSGHGTLSFQVGSGPSNDYAFQLVQPNQAFLIEINAGDGAVTHGSMEGQSASLSRASLNGPYALGTASPAACGCTSIAGVVTLDGANGKFIGARDTSRPGGVSPRDSLSGTFDLSTLGRGPMTTVTPDLENSVIYAVSPDKFVSINVDPTVTLSVVTLFER